MRLFLPRFVFRAELIQPAAFRFTTEIFLRLGPVYARLNKRVFDAVREHMRKEDINFKRHVEYRAAA